MRNEHTEIAQVSDLTSGTPPNEGRFWQNSAQKGANAFFVEQDARMSNGKRATQLAIEVAKVADAWRKGLASPDSASSILTILFCLETEQDQQTKHAASGTPIWVCCQTARPAQSGYCFMLLARVALLLRPSFTSCLMGDRSRHDIASCHTFLPADVKWHAIYTQAVPVHLCILVSYIGDH